MPKPKPSTDLRFTASTLEAKKMRADLLTKAVGVVGELLNHPSPSIRLAAAVDIQDRVEGKPVQAVQVDGPSPEQQRGRAELSAFFAFIDRTQPEKFGVAAAWIRSVAAGEPVPPPPGLVPPASGLELDLWRRATAVAAPALQENTRA